MVRESREKEKATHSSILAWKIPWTEKPGAYSSWISRIQIYISVFVLVPYCLDDSGFVVEPEVRQVDSFSSILLSRDCFGYSRVLYFHINCEIICSSSVKNTIGRLIGIVQNLQTGLGGTLIFTILIFSIQEHCIYLHVFVSSLISFISVLQFSIHRSFVSLGEFNS